MEMVKLKKDDRVIERNKVDYENNKDIGARRGWSLDDGKPAKPEPKPEPPTDQTIIEEEPKPKKTTKKAE